MAYVLIGGTAVGTVLTLAFLPALYAIWFRVSHVDAVRSNHGQQAAPREDVRKYAAEQGIAEEEALKKGMEEESREFTEKRAEVYVNG